MMQAPGLGSAGLNAFSLFVCPFICLFAGCIIRSLVFSDCLIFGFSFIHFLILFGEFHPPPPSLVLSLSLSPFLFPLSLSPSLPHSISICESVPPCFNSFTFCLIVLNILHTGPSNSGFGKIFL